MHLFAGSSHEALAAALARELKTTLGKLTTKSFSSGERYVRYEESIRGKSIYILQTGGKKPNEDLMELFLLCQAAKLSFAETVHVILPHFPYARQDRVAEPREPVSAKLMAHLLEESGADHVLTLDLHSEQIQGFFSIPVDSLTSRSIFAEYIRGKKLKDPVVVAPDAGGAKRAKKLASMIGADLAIMHKDRSRHHEAEILNVIGDVEGRTCIIVDDMIDTGSSMAPAREALRKCKANDDVYAAATHAIFSGKAKENLTKAGFKEIIVTDSVPVPTDFLPNLTVLSIAPLLSDVINHIERGESVSSIGK